MRLPAALPTIRVGAVAAAQALGEDDALTGAISYGNARMSNDLVLGPALTAQGIGSGDNGQPR